MTSNALKENCAIYESQQQQQLTRYDEKVNSKSMMD